MKIGNKEGQFASMFGSSDEDDQVFARLNREDDGSLTNSDGVTLAPAGRTAQGNRAYRIEEGGRTVGSVVVSETDGEIDMLHNIEIDVSMQGKGIRERVIKSILASADGGLKIVDVTNCHDGKKDIRPFWTLVGTRWVNNHRDADQIDGLLSWRDYASARLQAGGRPGIDPSNRTDAQGKPSQGYLTETGEAIGGEEDGPHSAAGIEVEEVSPEEAGKWTF